MARKSAGEELLELQLRGLGITGWVREYRFHPARRWRSDFAFDAERLLVEIQGGSWSNGRHTRGAGYEADCIKYGEAMKLGWNVYNCTTGMVKSGAAIETIEALLKLARDCNGRHCRHC